MLSLFNVTIRPIEKNELMLKLQAVCDANEKCHIVTLNPEILLEARKNDDYAGIINDAEIKVIDGFGIKFLSALKKASVGQRITGVNLSGYLMSLAKKKGLKIGLVTREDGLSSINDIEKVTKNYGNVRVYSLNKNDSLKKLVDEVIDREILLVGLGAPHQEVLISKIRDHLPKLKIAMGVGGVFDFWTGKRRRAPRLVRAIGLEWIWRFFHQPNRFFRMWNSAIVFPWRGLTDKLRDEIT